MFPTLKNMPNVDARVSFRLSAKNEFSPENPSMDMKLIGSQLADSPFPKGEFGSIGLAPNGKFLSYLKAPDSFIWKDKKINIVISAGKADAFPSGFSSSNNGFTSVSLSFGALSLPAKMLPIDPI